MIRQDTNLFVFLQFSNHLSYGIFQIAFPFAVLNLVDNFVVNKIDILNSVAFVTHAPDSVKALKPFTTVPEWCSYDQCDSTLTTIVNAAHAIIVVGKINGVKRTFFLMHVAKFIKGRVFCDAHYERLLGKVLMQLPFSVYQHRTLLPLLVDHGGTLIKGLHCNLFIDLWFSYLILCTGSIHFIAK